MKAPCSGHVALTVPAELERNWLSIYCNPNMKNSVTDSLSRQWTLALHLVDRANLVYFRLVTESATDERRECQVKPKPDTCIHATARKHKQNRFKSSRSKRQMQAQGIVWWRVFSQTFVLKLLGRQSLLWSLSKRLQNVIQIQNVFFGCLHLKELQYILNEE